MKTTEQMNQAADYMRRYKARQHAKRLLWRANKRADRLASRPNFVQEIRDRIAHGATVADIVVSLGIPSSRVLSLLQS